jgi:K+-sensing histidine kinase KdpD
MDRKIELDLPKQPSLALAHHELLRSATLGLCDNALTHASDSSKPIILSAKKRSSDSIVRLSVRDHGPQISKDIFRRLVERLGKMPQPISDHPAASGLGLYIAGQFAEAMQGRLGAVAHRQGGATFYIETSSVQQLSFLPSV